MRPRVVDNGNGLAMHVLEAGDPRDPCLLLLHGFPEIAYSWRKVMPALAAAGFHVVAPDQRGYGRTTGWDAAYDGDVDSFRLLNWCFHGSGQHEPPFRNLRDQHPDVWAQCSAAFQEG